MGIKTLDFFYNFTSGRRRNNQLKRIKDKTGIWREDNEDMQEVIDDYFTDLFKFVLVKDWLTQRDKVSEVTEQ